MRFTTAGLEFVVILCLLTGGGVLLDRWLETKAVFTVLGAACGFGLATFRLVLQARSIGRQAPGEKDGGGSTPGAGGANG
jgi:F0F1-type ATP synthase assembly protein I